MPIKDGNFIGSGCTNAVLEKSLNWCYGFRMSCLINKQKNYKQFNYIERRLSIWDAEPSKAA